MFPITTATPIWYALSVAAAVWFGVWLNATLSDSRTTKLMQAHAEVVKENVQLKNQLEIAKKDRESALHLAEKRSADLGLAVARVDRLAAELAALQPVAIENRLQTTQITLSYARGFLMLVTSFFIATILFWEWNVSLMAIPAQVASKLAGPQWAKADVRTGPVPHVDPQALEQKGDRPNSPGQLDWMFILKDLAATLKPIARPLSAALSGATLILFAALALVMAMHLVPR